MRRSMCIYSEQTLVYPLNVRFETVEDDAYFPRVEVLRLSFCNFRLIISQAVRHFDPSDFLIVRQ